MLLVFAFSTVFQVLLVRLFYLNAFSHLAFFAVMLAILGIGLGASVQGAFPLFRRREDLATLLQPAVTLLIYLLYAAAPYDLYQLPWHPKHVFLFALHTFLFLFPFFFAGALLANRVAAAEERGAAYASGFLGACAGSLLAYALLSVLSPERSLAAAAGAAVAMGGGRVRPAAGAAVALAGLWLLPPPPTSPYRPLPQLLQAEGAEVIRTRVAPYGVFHVVEAPHFRPAAALSPRYTGDFPRSLAVARDGGNLQPLFTAPSDEKTSFLAHQPERVAYELVRPQSVAVLGARTGFEVEMARSFGALRVTAVEPQRTYVRILQAFAAEAYNGAVWGVTSPRYFLRRTNERYDLVVVPLPESFIPVRPSTLWLEEDFLYTVEGVASVLEVVSGRGAALFHRYLQFPPSEEVRTAELIAGASRRMGKPPSEHLIVFYTQRSVLFLWSFKPWGATQSQKARRLISFLNYDVLHHPRMTRYLPDHLMIGDDHFNLIRKALAGRGERLPTDMRPYFYNFFKWEAALDAVRGIRGEWLPFGGVEFLFIPFTLFITGAFSLLVLAAARVQGATKSRHRPYFFFTGVGFMFVEIPLLYTAILLLTHPPLAFALSIALFLFCSGLGSLNQKRHSVLLLAAIVPGTLAAAFVLPHVPKLLSLPPPLAAFAFYAVCCPLFYLCGTATPLGLARVERADVPLALALNLIASVLAGGVAMLCALFVGYHRTLALAAVFFALALAVRPRTVPVR